MYVCILVLPFNFVLPLFPLLTIIFVLTLAVCSFGSVYWVLFLCCCCCNILWLMQKVACCPFSQIKCSLLSSSYIHTYIHPSIYPEYFNSNQLDTQFNKMWNNKNSNIKYRYISFNLRSYFI